MPDMKAIVPPETPGTTSAAPMDIPFKEITTYCLKDLFILQLVCDYEYRRKKRDILQYVEKPKK